MIFRYSIEKNAELIKDRGLGFEEIIEEIKSGNLLNIVNHYNLIKYPNQKILYVRVLKQVFLVPMVIDESGAFFLKTLYPSRKATKTYINIKK